jgi:hypothetical protein
LEWHQQDNEIGVSYAHPLTETSTSKTSADENTCIRVKEFRYNITATGWKREIRKMIHCRGQEGLFYITNATLHQPLAS